MSSNRNSNPENLGSLGNPAQYLPETPRDVEECPRTETLILEILEVLEILLNTYQKLREMSKNVLEQKL